MKINIINEAINELNNKLSEYDYSMELSSDNKIIYVKDTSRTILNLDMRVYLDVYSDKDELIEMIQEEINDKLNEVRMISQIVQDKFVSVKDDLDNDYDRVINAFPEYVENEGVVNNTVYELVLLKEDIIKTVYEDYLYHKGGDIYEVKSKHNYYEIGFDTGFNEVICIISDDINKLTEERINKIDIITIDSRFSEDVIMNVADKCKNVEREYVNVC